MTPEMIERRNELAAQLGEPVGPTQAHSFGAALGRGCGKTYEMIRALPEDGNAAIVVSKLEHWRNHLRQQILIQRPGYPVDKLRVVEHVNAFVTLRGEPLRPVFVDNAVTDVIAYRFVEVLNAPRLPDQVVEEVRTWP